LRRAGGGGISKHTHTPARPTTQGGAEGLEVVGAKDEDDDDMDETTCTRDDDSRNNTVPSVLRQYGSFSDCGYHVYPELSFLVNHKPPGTKTTDEEGPTRQHHDIGAKKNSSPPPTPPPSGEPWYLKWKESNAAMWLGHFTFILGAIFYLKCAWVDLDWIHFARVTQIVPDDVLDEDDDDAWTRWEKNNLDRKTRHAVEDMRENYDRYSTLYCMLGGAFFVVCGFADLLYYCEYVDLFMIFAGIAGVLSATSDTTEMEGRWNFLSCHMYLLEAYSSVRRQHQDIDEMGEIYDGHYFFLFSRMCFLGGCIMDVSCFTFSVYHSCTRLDFDLNGWQIVVSYLELSPWESSFLDVYSDLTSCLLWMVCAIVDVCAELYFLEAEEEEEKKEEDKEDDAHVQEG
jgi:hypothetical protein